MSAPSTSQLDHERRKKKHKSAKSQAVVDDSHDGADGRGGDWSYSPPAGSVPLTDYLDEPDFDFDALRDDDDLELWVIKVPEGVKPKHLHNVKLDVPSSRSSSLIGSVSRKNATYDVWSINKESQQAVHDTIAGADDLFGLTCLVPRNKKGGGLYTAPVPVSHHLVLTAAPTLPTPPPTPEQASSAPNQNPERYRHPKSLLKHRFLPYGSSTAGLPISTALEPEMEDKSEAVAPPSLTSVTSPKSKGTEKERTKERKRKVAEGETPKQKKLKKTKAES